MYSSDYRVRHGFFFFFFFLGGGVGGGQLPWHWHFLISYCSQNDFAQNVWRDLIKSHTTSNVHYSGSFLICWPACAIIIVTDTHPGAKQVPEHQQQPCWLYFTDRVTQTYYIICIHHQTEREARGPLTYHFLCYPWVRFLNAIDNIINNAAQITIQWVVASLHGLCFILSVWIPIRLILRASFMQTYGLQAWPPLDVRTSAGTAMIKFSSCIQEWHLKGYMEL